MKTLIKVDRNGTKYYADDTCRRCGGLGYSNEWYYTGCTCWECGGSGHSKIRIEKVYTPEYQAKLDARREKKQAAERAKMEAEEAKRAEELKAKEEAERIERERIEREEAERKAVSKYVGTVGEKLQIKVKYIGSPYYTIRDPWGREETRYIHTFKDENGNKIVWKTGCGISLEEEQEATIKATVKEHSEYKEEKQTAVLRLKVIG